MQLKNLGNSQSAIPPLTKTLSKITNFNNIPSKIQDELKQTTSNYSKKVLIAAINQKVFTEEQARTILTAKGIKAAEIEQCISTANLATSQTVATATTGGLSAALQGLLVKLKSAALAMKDFLLTTPLGWGLMIAGAYCADG